MGSQNWDRFGQPKLEASPIQRKPTNPFCSPLIVLVVVEIGTKVGWTLFFIYMFSFEIGSGNWVLSEIFYGYKLESLIVVLFKVRHGWNGFLFVEF